MNISKSVKILIGFLTAFAIVVPFFILPAVMMFFVFSAGLSFSNPQAVPNPNEMEAMIPFIFVFYPLMMCYSVVQLGLQIFYVIHEIKNKALTDNIRILFTIGTFFLPYFAMPIYFFIYLWKENSPETQVVQA